MSARRPAQVARAQREGYGLLLSSVEVDALESAQSTERSAGDSGMCEAELHDLVRSHRASQTIIVRPPSYVRCPCRGTVVSGIQVLRAKNHTAIEVGEKK